MNYYVPKGENLYRTTSRMVAIANALDEPVHAVFNATEIEARPGDDPSDVYRSWEVKRGVVTR